MARKVVFETREIQTIYAEQDSDFLLITFAQATMPANGWRFFGANLAERNKVSTLGFVATRANWYPGADMRAAAGAVRPILNRFRERVCIGYSMGGYATVKYASLLGSDTSIALSPQYSVQPADCPDHLREDLRETLLNLKVDLSCVDQDMRIGPDSGHGRIYVFYDNTIKVDFTHTAHIAQQVKLTEIAMPYRRHFLDRCFAETAALARLINVCRSGSEVAIRSLARERRKMGSSRAYFVGCELVHRHLGWGMTLLECHGSRMEIRERTDLTNRLAKAAIERGDFLWPVGALEQLLDQDCADAQSYTLLATAYLNLDNLPMAASALRKRLDLVPDDACAWEKLIHTLARMHDLPGSLEEVSRAVQLCPNEAGLLHRASDIAQKAGKTTEAIEYLRRAISISPPLASSIEKLAVLLFKAEYYDEADEHFDWFLRLRSEQCPRQVPLYDRPALAFQDR
jgi:tetratricopeptide (TPR) repeat protein